jgi:hypothetical protein
VTAGGPGRRTGEALARPGSPPSIRVALYGAVAIVAALAPFALLLPPPLRVTVGFIFVLFGPGAAVTGWFPKLKPVAEVLIATVLSLVITTAAGEVMLTVRAWSPLGYAAVVAPVVVIMLVRHIISLALGRSRFGADQASQTQ